MVCLPIQHLNGWLFGIQTGKVHPDAKEKLLLYKRECYKVLHEHFFGKYKVVASNTKEVHVLQGRQKKLESELRKVKANIKKLQSANFEALDLDRAMLQEGGEE